MTITESYIFFPTRLRAVAPAPAREILRANTESLATDTVFSVSMSGGAEREALVAELRETYQAGKYKIDEAQVSAKLIEEHLGK